MQRPKHEIFSLPSVHQFLTIWCKILIFFFAHLRSIHLAYVEDVEVKGIQAYRFAPPSDVLMSPKDNPTNEGFCVPAGDCLGTGVLKVSVCRQGELMPNFLPTLFLCQHPLQISPDSKQTCWALYLTFPLFEHTGFYSIHESMINCSEVCLRWSLSGEWLLWYTYHYPESWGQKHWKICYRYCRNYYYNCKDKILVGKYVCVMSWIILAWWLSGPWMMQTRMTGHELYCPKSQSYWSPVVIFQDTTFVVEEPQNH